ncbi:MAG: hypothetical protein ACT4QG_21965 [Sporichthyaceae bacterium]
MIEVVVEWLSANTPSPSATPVDSSKVEAGVIGLAFFVVMGLVVLALVLSMRRHLGRVDVTRHAREKKGAKPPEGAG